MRKTGSDQVCERCGTLFYVPGWRAQRGEPVKFCSRECLWAGRNRRQKAAPVTLVCAQCAGAFEVQPHRATKAKYCSAKCGVAAQHVEKAVARKLLEEETLQRGFKTCGECRQTKPVGEFWTRADTGLLRNDCKSCITARTRAWVEGNPDRKREMDRAYHAAHCDEAKEWQGAYYEENREAILARNRAYRLQHLEEERERNRLKRLEKGDAIRAARREHYRQNKSRYVAQSVMRTERIKIATPPWADFEAIAAVYEESDRLTQQTGIVHHVDHDIPLRGKNVCGLHVHTNLRILTAKENLAKSNRFEEAV